MSERHPNVLSAENVFLLVVDVQERFRTVQENFGRMVEGCLRLVKTFRILELPIFLTEQYPQALGSTVPEFLEVLGQTRALAKTCFSSCGSPELAESIKALQRDQALVCGIETHVCVNQTVHDLLHRGFSVQVAVDAIESRKAMDREVALLKMERSGAVLTTTEAAAFELLRDAKNPRFKEVQALFK